MNIFSLVSFSALAATLLVGCEPQKDVVAPQAVTSNKSARVASATDSYGQMGLYFGGKYDNGVTPTVAMNGKGYAVEVHKSQNNQALWFRVGRTSGTSITWSKSAQIWDANNMIVPVYAKNPSVTMNGNMATVVYTNLTGLLCIAYISVADDGTKAKAAIGQLVDLGLDDDSRTINSVVGDNPSVVVTADERTIISYERNHKLYYIRARKQSAETVWSKTEEMYDTGKNPTIAANSSGMLIEMHEDVVNGDYRLYRKWGQLTKTASDTKIQWLNPEGGSGQYSTGTEPSVAIDDDGNVVEVHASYNKIHRTVAILRNESNIYTYFRVVNESILRDGAHASVALASVNGRKQVIVNINGGGVPSEQKELFAGTNGF